MPRRPLAFRAALVAGVLTILAAGFFTAPRVPAQGPAAPRVLALGPIDAPGNGRDAGQWLQDGSRLEVEHRWGEALSHFEESLRQFPGDGDLKQHFDTARLHYELGRRYNDRSFRDGLARMSLQDASDLYSEVLLKLQAHYVELPKWDELVACGARSLEIALGETTYLQAAGPRAPAPVGPRSAEPVALRSSDSAGPRLPEADLEKYRQELHQLLASRKIQSRVDAGQAAAAVASMTHDRLGTDSKAVVMEFVCAAVNSLDPYSSYLTPDQLTDVYSQIEGHFVGLGVELKAVDGQLAIVRVIPNSPAKQGGLRDGERIVAVGGVSTRELSTDRAANLLQGQEGTSVNLTVADAAGKTREVTLKRQRVDVPSVDETQILDQGQGIAYLKLTCFQKSTARDLEAALWNLQRLGMKGLVMDLRGNPGGLLVAAVDAADLFIDKGSIVTTRGRNSEEDFTYMAREPGTWRVPLVVLIDQESASAAEIFAGAIRDHNRGTIIGTRSYGKGSIQGIFPLGIGNAGLRLTTAKFYAPSGYPYSGIGVEPHVVVRRVAKPINAAPTATADASARPAFSDPDAVLAAGLQVLRQSLAQR
jgi:carboxyl-terminal processing protease